MFFLSIFVFLFIISVYFSVYFYHHLCSIDTKIIINTNTNKPLLCLCSFMSICVYFHLPFIRIVCVCLSSYFIVCLTDPYHKIHKQTFIFMYICIFLFTIICVYLRFADANDHKPSQKNNTKQTPFTHPVPRISIFFCRSSSFRERRRRR